MTDWSNLIPAKHTKDIKRYMKYKHVVNPNNFSVSDQSMCIDLILQNAGNVGKQVLCELVVIMAESVKKIKIRKDDNELLIFGYTRKILDENTMNVYPLDIFNVIKRIYLNIILFRWDKEHHGTDIYFETKEDNTEILISRERSYGICLSNIVLDESKTKSAYWECELHSFDGDNYICIYLGYVSYPITKSINSYKTWLGQQDESKQFGVVMSSNWRTFWCYSGNKYPTCGQKLSSLNKKYEFKDGIRVGLNFDFVDKTCQLFYNGEKVVTVL